MRSWIRRGKPSRLSAAAVYAADPDLSDLIDDGSDSGFSNLSAVSWEKEGGSDCDFEERCLRLDRSDAVRDPGGAHAEVGASRRRGRIVLSGSDSSDGSVSGSEPVRKLGAGSLPVVSHVSGAVPGGLRLGQPSHVPSMFLGVGVRSVDRSGSQPALSRGGGQSGRSSANRGPVVGTVGANGGRGAGRGGAARARGSKPRPVRGVSKSDGGVHGRGKRGPRAGRVSGSGQAVRDQGGAEAVVSEVGLGGGVGRSLPDNSRHQDWFFTCNNWTAFHRGRLDGLTCDYMCYQPEIGESGTRHLQGWFRLAPQQGRTFPELRAKFGTAFHFERLKGTYLQADEYCSKEESKDQGAGFGTIRRGVLPDQKRRSAYGVNLEHLVRDAQEGVSARELASKYPVPYLRNFRGVDHVRTLFAKPRDPEVPPTVYWFWGPTGTGKSRCARQTLPSAYYKLPGDAKWWDGYECGQSVIWEEMRCRTCDYAYLLRLLDRYPLNVEVKGSVREFNAPVIIITSPMHPVDVYHDIDEDINQLLRRITRCTFFDETFVQHNGFDAGATHRKNFASQPAYRFV